MDTSSVTQGECIECKSDTYLAEGKCTWCHKKRYYEIWAEHDAKMAKSFEHFGRDTLIFVGVVFAVILLLLLLL